MSDKKYGADQPTRRIEDWKPFNASGETRPAGQGGAAGLTGGGSGGETRFVPEQKTSADGKPIAPTDFMGDPDVGYLVVIKGPGKGKGLRLGLGQNTIGRGDGNRVRLDFGDQQISRDKHCVVTFEPKRRVFYIQNDSGQNLTYVGDVVVLQPQELRPGETITVGGTELRFLPLCGPDFSWETAGS